MWLLFVNFQLKNQLNLNGGSNGIFSRSITFGIEVYILKVDAFKNTHIRYRKSLLKGVFDKYFVYLTFGLVFTCLCY